MMDKNDLVKPAIPIFFIFDLFTQVGSESLSTCLTEGRTGAAVDALYDAIKWAIDLKNEATEYGGRVTRSSNEAAGSRMMAG